MRLLLLFILLLPAASIAAQDRICLIDGDTIVCRVLSVSKDRVKYKLASGNDSELHKIRGNDVALVIYEDGNVWPTSPAHLREIEYRKEVRLREVPAYVWKGYPNVVTAQCPGYMRIGGYPGIVLGIAYERFLDREGTFSASLAMSRYWAGTAAWGRMDYNEVRTNIQGWHFTPGFFYHPGGNANGYDFAVGASFPLGTISRYDVQGPYYTYTIAPATYTLAAALLQVNMSLHSRGHFVFTTTVAGGPMLRAGNTSGAMLLIGVKLGGRF